MFWWSELNSWGPGLHFGIVKVDFDPKTIFFRFPVIFFYKKWIFRNFSEAILRISSFSGDFVGFYPMKPTEMSMKSHMFINFYEIYLYFLASHFSFLWFWQQIWFYPPSNILTFPFLPPVAYRYSCWEKRQMARPHMLFCVFVCLKLLNNRGQWS